MSIGQFTNKKMIVVSRVDVNMGFPIILLGILRMKRKKRKKKKGRERELLVVSN